MRPAKICRPQRNPGSPAPRHERGQEEGKDRPAAIILVVEDDGEHPLVTVLPITHTPPAGRSAAVEIPSATKRRLGLDVDRSWIILRVMNVRFKMTNKGEVAILPRKDFEALAARAREADEDIGTARLVARARRDIAAGMPLIPKEVVDRICAGENALRVVREWRGKTQLYIAQKARIGQGYISDLESGRRRGTITALKKIADALRVPLDLIA